MSFVYLDNDNVLILERLAATTTQSAGLVNTASVYVTLVASGDGSGVSGQTWPTDFTLVNSDTGRWEAALSDGLSLTENEYYEALITADAGDGFKASWRYPLKGIYRR